MSPDEKPAQVIQMSERLQKALDAELIGMKGIDPDAVMAAAERVYDKLGLDVFDPCNPGDCLTLAFIKANKGDRNAAKKP